MKQAAELAKKDMEMNQIKVQMAELSKLSYQCIGLHYSATELVERSIQNVG